MIECSSDNVWYSKRKRKRKKRGLRLFVFLLIITGFFLYGRFVVAVNLTKICTDYCYSYATESVNESILFSLEQNVKYADLIKIEKDDNGQIVLMSTDSYKVNYVNREIVKFTEINLKNKLKQGIPVPILAFSGLEFISPYGFPVYIKSISVASVESSFSSAFQSVGINQTLHSIYINVICKVKIHVPLYSEIKECKTQILVSEAILVGKVPDVYLTGSLFN